MEYKKIGIIVGGCFLFLVLLSVFSWTFFSNRIIIPSDFVTVKEDRSSIVPSESISVPSDETKEFDEAVWLQDQLRQSVERRGYTMEQWRTNNISRDVKWEITKEHSKRILVLLNKDE